MKVPKFFEVSRSILTGRLNQVLEGNTPSFTDLRHLFYQCRNRFLRENPELNEIDTLSKAPYQNWIDAVVNKFCIRHASLLDIDPDRWWLLRDKLNIWAEGRAICEGEISRIIIDYTTRDQVDRRCSFILICEKKTVREMLLKTLQSEGYRLNIIASVGHNVADLKEAIINATEHLDPDKPTFHILHLHDYDIDGIAMFFDLKKHYANIIDVGINREFLSYLERNGSIDRRMVEEQNLIRKEHRDILEHFKTSDIYDWDDYEYLQGELMNPEAKRGRKWKGKRIEIDAIATEYGVQPFIDYVLMKIQNECLFWDLSRIGIESFSLEEPENHYDKAVTSLTDRVARAYGEKLFELSKTLNVVLDIIKKTLTLDPAYVELEDKYRGEEGKKWNVREGGGKHIYSYYEAELKSVKPLLEEYDEAVNRVWTDDYEEDLEAINEQITRFEGDVREGEEILKQDAVELQQQLETDKKDDPNLAEFKEKLKEIDWGEEELDELTAPSEAEALETAIDALQVRLEELEK